MKKVQKKFAKIEKRLICPDCGKSLIKRTNKYGVEFIGCTGFPNCRYTSTVDKPLGRVKMSVKQIMGKHYREFSRRSGADYDTLQEWASWHDPYYNGGNIWGL